MEVYMRKRNNKEIVRTSASIPLEYYQKLENLAEEKNVSIAWTIRDAIKKYLQLQYENHDNSNYGRK